MNEEEEEEEKDEEKEEREEEKRRRGEATSHNLGKCRLGFPPQLDRL